MSSATATGVNDPTVIELPGWLQSFKTKNALAVYALAFVFLVLIFAIVWYLWGREYEHPKRPDDDEGVVVYRVESGTGFWVILAVIIAVICVYKLASKTIDHK